MDKKAFKGWQRQAIRDLLEELEIPLLKGTNHWMKTVNSRLHCRGHGRVVLTHGRGNDHTNATLVCWMGQSEDMLQVQP